MEKLSKTEAICIIRTEIAGRYDEPTQVWRVEVPFPKERLASRLRKHINLRRFRVKNRA